MVQIVLDLTEAAVCPRCGCEAALYPCAGGAWLCVDCLGEQLTGDLDLPGLPEVA
jgi:hypothetical protein